MSYCYPARQKRNAEGFFHSLYLKTLNKDSLVFYLKTEYGRSGILFTADSDLHNIDIGGVAAGSVVTAPHRGARANRKAYDK